jgi:hypothetical protein
VNPYTEPDEEEEKAKEEEKNKDADHVMLLCILFQLDSISFLCICLSPMVLTFVYLNSG